MAAPFLVAQLGANARIMIEVAWGADINADYLTWTWTDITADVRIADGIQIKHGRGDEAGKAQPASCSMILNNKLGAYSLGGQSSNWPNVKQNTPVRVRYDPNDGSGYRTLFVGYADSWQPAWNVPGTDSEVKLTASGILRRLQQNDSPVLSSLRRRLSTETNVVAYWPLEEGDKAGAGLSGLLNGPSMGALGTVAWAGDKDSFASTVQLPVLKFGRLFGPVPGYTLPAKQQVRMLMTFPENGTGMVNNCLLVRLNMNSASLNRFEVYWTTGGGLTTQGFSLAGVTYTNTFSNTTAFAANGKKVRLYLELEQSGGNILWRTGIQTPGAGGSFANGTVAGTMGTIASVDIGPNMDFTGLGVGHVTVQNNVTSIFTDAQELDAFEGEVSHTRFTRLMNENGIESFVSGDSTVFSQPTDRMGEQKPEPLTTLLDQIQEVDRGIVYDGTSSGGGGVAFASRRAIEDRVTSFTVDVGAKQLAGILSPVDDDQGRLNKAVVTRTDGATAVFEDVTGPLGTATVGTYDSSLTIPTYTDGTAIQYASWAVNLGTVEGYRYPSVDLSLTRTPALAPAMSLLRPGSRIDLTNISTVASQHPARDVSLVVQGFEQTLTPHTWDVTLTCTPYAPWQVGRAVNTNGTPGTGLPDVESLRADTSASQLNSAAALGATSLSVATTSGPIWTTSSQDMPLKIEVGGIVVTVTAISGASSPQTFTVTGVTKALASGLAVKLYQPPVIGL